jgi:hypothetical protein
MHRFVQPVVNRSGCGSAAVPTRKIAQGFSAGKSRQNGEVPLGTKGTPNNGHRFCRPGRDSRDPVDRNPALKRWAISDLFRRGRGNGHARRRAPGGRSACDAEFCQSGPDPKVSQELDRVNAADAAARRPYQEDVALAHSGFPARNWSMIFWKRGSLRNASRRLSVLMLP